MAGELTDTSLKAAIRGATAAWKAQNIKVQKIFDAKGLYLLMSPPSSPGWRLKYYFPAKKERLMSLGTYPDVTLKRAREKRDEARRLIADGIDPSVRRKAAKQSQADTFAAIAAEWLDLQRKKMSAKTIEKAEWTLRDLLNPYVGSRPITAITSPEVLSVLRRLESRGKHETAHRTKQRASQIFRYAIATGRAERDGTHSYQRRSAYEFRWPTAFERAIRVLCRGYLIGSNSRVGVRDSLYSWQQERP